MPRSNSGTNLQRLRRCALEQVVERAHDDRMPTVRRRAEPCRTAHNTPAAAAVHGVSPGSVQRDAVIQRGHPTRTSKGDVVLAAVVLHDGRLDADAHERLAGVRLLVDRKQVRGRHRPGAIDNKTRT